MSEGKFVAYYRVSTQEQGRSGLGLDAQRAAVLSHLNGGEWELIAEFTEVESGKKSDRPQLAEALRLCRKTGATLVIAKLDRLARSVAFIANLMEQKVTFVAADMPSATPFMLHIYAAVAQEERRAIAARTKAALKAKKEWLAGLSDAERAELVRQGKRTKLGGPKVKEAAKLAAAVRIARADAHARNIMPIVEQIQRTGITTLRGIAGALQARGVPTARGGTWQAEQVRALLSRKLA